MEWTQALRPIHVMKYADGFAGGGKVLFIDAKVQADNRPVIKAAQPTNELKEVFGNKNNKSFNKTHSKIVRDIVLECSANYARRRFACDFHF